MTSLHSAIARILRPLARIMIARGVRFPEFVDWAKRAFLQSAERDFRIDGKRVTDSRIHLLTGLQRKDVKALRERADQGAATGAGPLARVVGLWLAEYRAPDGTPRPLPRAGDDPSFQALVARISRDIHPRTVLDELVRLGMVEAAGDEIRLATDGFVPSGDDAALTGYLGANLGDHALAAAENVLAAPAPGPHFERAAHYNRLTPEALAELDGLSRRLLGEALAEINARAAALQARDAGRPDAAGRFRAGAYLLTREEADE